MNYAKRVNPTQQARGLDCPHCQQAIFLSGQPMQMRIIDRDGFQREIEPEEPDVVSDELPPEARWELAEYYAKVVRPALVAEGKSKARLSDYKTAVTRWQECFSVVELRETKRANPSGKLDLRTPTPLLYQITPATLEEFRAWLLKGITTPHGADKNAAVVVAILRRAETAWVIPRLPKIKSATRPRVGVLFTFLTEEMSKLHAAATGTQWPMKTNKATGSHAVDPALYWRLFLAGGYTYGFRPQEWWRFDNRRDPARALSWGGVNFDPVQEVHKRKIENEHGWLTWEQTKTCRTMILPMNAAVRRAVEGVRDALSVEPQAADRVFPFPLSAGTSKGDQPVYPSSGFYAAWWDLVKRAGIDAQTETDSRGREMHTTHAPKHFRKTARTIHQMRIGSASNWITGHLPKTVGERNYFNAVEQVIESINAMQMPDAF